jgi:hypothetical protein
LNNLSEKCGNWDQENYSFSAILINEKKKLNFEFEEFARKYNNNVYSFTDKIVYFETNVSMMKSISYLLKIFFF